MVLMHRCCFCRRPEQAPPHVDAGRELPDREYSYGKERRQDAGMLGTGGPLLDPARTYDGEERRRDAGALGAGGPLLAPCLHLRRRGAAAGRRRAQAWGRRPSPRPLPAPTTARSGGGTPARLGQEALSSPPACTYDGDERRRDAGALGAGGPLLDPART